MRSIDEKEKDVFNEFIKEHPCGSVFQSYEWGEVKKNTGWMPTRLVLEQEGRIRGAVSLLMKGLHFTKMAYSPRGPVVDVLHPELFFLFKEGVRDYLREQDVDFWKMDPEIGCSREVEFAFGDFFSAKTSRGFGGIQPRSVWRVHLNGGHYPKERLEKPARRQLKLATKEGIKTRRGTREDIPLFYSLLHNTAGRKAFSIRSQKYFEDIWDALHPAGMLSLRLGYKGDEAVCGALATPFGRGVWDIYAGTNESARRTGASYFLTWELINDAAADGFSFYDLGGIPVEAHEDKGLGGLYQFKSRFGGKREDFVGEYDYIFSPLKHRMWHLAMGVKGYFNV